MFIFPGLGLGVVSSKASKVSDRMFYVAAQRLADCVSDSDLAAGKVCAVACMRVFVTVCLCLCLCLCLCVHLIHSHNGTTAGRFSRPSRRSAKCRGRLPLPSPLLLMRTASPA